MRPTQPPQHPYEDKNFIQSLITDLIRDQAQRPGRRNATRLAAAVTAGVGAIVLLQGFAPLGFQLSAFNFLVITGTAFGSISRLLWIATH